MRRADNKISKKKFFLFVLNSGIIFCLISCVLLGQEDPQNPDWRKYHNTSETYALFEKWAEAYPGFINLYSIYNRHFLPYRRADLTPSEELRRNAVEYHVIANPHGGEAILKCFVVIMRLPHFLREFTMTIITPAAATSTRE